MKTGKKLVTEMFKKSLVVAGVLLFLAGTAQTSKSDFKKCDKDGDKKISKTEFSDRYSDDHKAKKDVKYDEDKFYESSYSLWDADKNSRLSEGEWKDGFDASYGYYVEDDFSKYDVNQNGTIEFEEYQRALFNSEYYSNWDVNRDNTVDQKEYSDMVFQSVDKNDDNYLDEDEYAEYHKRKDSYTR